MPTLAALLFAMEAGYEVCWQVVAGKGHIGDVGDRAGAFNECVSSVDACDEPRCGQSNS